jgi:hypothetical protein
MSILRIAGILFGLILALDTWPAAAHPRDEALSGALGCAVIGDSRMWLDCYYGAAQPVRVELGLPSALPVQMRLAAAPPAGGVARDVRLRDTAIGEASRCRAQGDERAWLDCYYAAVQPLRTALGLSLMPQTHARSPQPPTGNWLLGSNRPEAVTHMTDYVFDGSGRFTATLDNGQVWRQMPGDVKKARWTKPAHSYVVTLNSGALGSTNLSVRGVPGIFKVEQLRGSVSGQP